MGGIIAIVILVAVFLLYKKNKQNTNSTAAKHPFADEIEKKYYEIAYGLFLSMEGERVGFDAIKKYIEHHIGEECDVEKLHKALTYCGSGSSYSALDGYVLKMSLRGVIPDSEIDKIVAFNKTLTQSANYRCTKEEALEICYNYTQVYTQAVEEATKSIKLEYDKVLDVVESNGVKFYNEGVNRIVEEIPKKHRIMAGNYTARELVDKTAVKEIIRAITKSKLLEGDAVVKMVLLAYIEHTLWSFQEKHAVASVALRAVHFDQHGQSKTGYTGITDDECRDFVLTENSFRSEINSNPYDVEKLTEENIDSIKHADIFFEGEFRNYWMPNANDDIYYADMLCNLFWKNLAQINDIDADQTVTTIYGMIFDSIQLSDSERQRREDKKREEEVRSATYEQCRGCAFVKNCDQKYKRPNCSAFVPK